MSPPNPITSSTACPPDLRKRGGGERAIKNRFENLQFVFQTIWDIIESFFKATLDASFKFHFANSVNFFLRNCSFLFFFFLTFIHIFISVFKEQTLLIRKYNPEPTKPDQVTEGMGLSSKSGENQTLSKSGENQTSLNLEKTKLHQNLEKTKLHPDLAGANSFTPNKKWRKK